MDLTTAKSMDRSKSELFGLLLSCLFSDEVKNKCPISRLRSSLTIEEKYNYVKKLSQEEVKIILNQHTKCYEMATISSMHLNYK